MSSTITRPVDAELERLAIATPLRAPSRRLEAADVPDREPARDDRLEPPQEPRRLRAARPLRRPRRRDRGPQPRHRPHPRGRRGRIRPRGRVRRRRHAERGRQRPRRLERPDDDPAGRLHERRLPHARHPDRHRRRDRAPAPARRCAGRTLDRPRPRQRPLLRLLERRGPRRRRDALGRRAPGDEGARPRAHIRLCRHRRLPPRLPRPPAAPLPRGAGASASRA